MDPTLILYALIAGGLVFWLRSILGTRSGEERERPNPFTAPVEPQNIKRDTLGENSVPEDVVTLSLDEPKPALPRNVQIANEQAERGLAEIARTDRTFDAGRFALNAQDAFVIIVEAFAAGDRETLRELLEPQVYTAFDQAIAGRETRGEEMSSEIHAVRKMEIMDVRFDGRLALVTIRFIADETCVVRGREGVILSGDPERITEMNDIWTFSRLVKNRDPIWLLHETRDGDITEEHKTPVPDAG